MTNFMKQSLREAIWVHIFLIYIMPTPILLLWLSAQITTKSHGQDLSGSQFTIS